MSTSPTPHPFTHTVLWASLIGSSTLIGTTALFWSLVDIVTPFLAPGMLLGVWGVFLLLLLISFIHMVFAVRRLRLAAVVPLAVNLIALLIVLNIPLARLIRDLDFQRNFSQRMAIVGMINTAELKASGWYSEQLIRMPFWYRHLSAGGGDIIVAHQDKATIIFFFTYRGVLDNFAGFMYRSDESVPQQGDLGGDYQEIEKLYDHWFWVAAS